MSYDSTADRKAETSTAEELHTEFDRAWSPYRRPAERCPWCHQLVLKHSEQALALCTQKFNEEIERRKQGPVRIMHRAGRPR